MPTQVSPKAHQTYSTQYPQGTSSGAPMDEKRAAEVKASEKQIKAMLGRMLPAKLERFTVGEFKKDVYPKTPWERICGFFRNPESRYARTKAKIYILDWQELR